jgi:hypothetical protein
MKILNEPALEVVLRWLGDYLKFELQRQGWEAYIESFPDEGATLWLFPPSWRLPGVDDYVAFSFNWSNKSDGDPPCVQLYLPAEERFPQRNQLLDRIRPQLRRARFSDHCECEGDPDPGYPLWRNLRLDFNAQTGVDLSAILSTVLKGFQDLMGVEKLIDEAVNSSPPPPPACDHELKTIAFLDTEWSGKEASRKMTELAAVNVAYNPVKEEVVGILEEYVMNIGETLNKPRARALLGRADRIVAHNSSSDETLLERELPGIDKSKWICSYRGIEWKRLTGVQSARQNTLMGKAGLRYEQDHHARADAHDLKRLLAQKHEGGRTYLGRLLDSDVIVLPSLETTRRTVVTGFPPFLSVASTVRSFKRLSDIISAFGLPVTG